MKIDENIPKAMFVRYMCIKLAYTVAAIHLGKILVICCNNNYGILFTKFRVHRYKMWIKSYCNLDWLNLRITVSNATSC